MAFAVLVYRAHKLSERQKKLRNEKYNALQIHQGFKPDYSLGDKIGHLQTDVKNAIKNCCGRIFSFPKGSWLHKTSVQMRHEGTMENYILKSVAGFVGGFFLTYLFFMFFAFILSYNLGMATLMCSIMGCILTVGLAFSQSVRCIVFLILPQFFSKKGRQALLAYAFVLALTGPGKNTLNNIGIMSESLACGQEQLKVAVKQILDVIKKPFVAIKEAIKKIIKVVKVIVVKIKEIFLTIKRIVMGIVRVIKAVFQFLSKIFNICSKKVGTPFQRCSRVFENSVLDCQAKLGPLFSWVCNIIYIVHQVCYIVKPYDFLCMILDFINTSIVGVIIRKIRTFVRQIRATFYVRVRFSHSFHFETIQSKTIREISSDILAEIKGRTTGVIAVFGFVSAATSCIIFIVVLKALHYRYKFLTEERFDNRFITNNIREIDFRRAQMEKETILPLNKRERNKYVDVASARLVKLERKQLSKSLSVLLSASFKLALHMLFDYGLYWILATIRYHGRYKNTVETPKAVGLHVEGEGFIASLYRSIVKAFMPLGVKMDLDSVPCLPDPIPPNFERYAQIGVIMILCWILAIFEPYGLRLRHSFMSYYHPGRARERAVWLYNNIMRGRNGFLKFARRQLRRQFLGEKGIAKITFIEFLRAKCDNKCCRIFLLGSDKQEACLLCGEAFRKEDVVQPIRCAKPGCPGIYCQQCFTDLNNLCTVCLEPIQYGDLSDVDEEKDSSEDEASAKSKRRSQLKLEKQKLNQESATTVPTNTETENEELQSLLPQTIENENEMDESARAEGGFGILDSDYSSQHSDSTDYSISYQYEKKIKELMLPTRQPFVDVEKQRIPDYASMDTFRENFVHQEENVKSSIEDNKTVFLPMYKGKYPSKQSEKYSYNSSTDSENENDEIYRKKYRPSRKKPKNFCNIEGEVFSHEVNSKDRQNEEELIPLLNLSKLDSDSTDSEQFEYYSESISSQNEIQNPTLEQPRLSSYGSALENSQENLFESTTPHYLPNEAPPPSEEPTLVSGEEGIDNNTESFRNNYLFPNVSVHEIDETPRSYPDYSEYSYIKNSSSTSSERSVRQRVSQNVKQAQMARFLEDTQTQSARYMTKVKEYYKKIKKNYS